MTAVRALIAFVTRFVFILIILETIALYFIIAIGVPLIEVIVIVALGVTRAVLVGFVLFSVVSRAAVAINYSVAIIIILVITV